MGIFGILVIFGIFGHFLENGHFWDFGYFGGSAQNQHFGKNGENGKKWVFGKMEILPQIVIVGGEWEKVENGILVIFGETVKMGIPGKCEKWQKVGFWNVMIFVFPVWENIQEYG